MSSALILDSALFISRCSACLPQRVFQENRGRWGKWQDRDSDYDRVQEEEEWGVKEWVMQYVLATHVKVKPSPLFSGP